MAIIKFGALDKKYLLVLFFPIIQIIITLFINIIQKKSEIQFLNYIPLH